MKGVIILFQLLSLAIKTMPTHANLQQATPLSPVRMEITTTHSDCLVQHLRTKVLTNNGLQNKNLRTKGAMSYLTVVLLANANDIAKNPGPATVGDSTVYLCGTCDTPVTWDDRAIMCDNCDQWYHVCCQEVGSGTYNNINDASGIRWDCILCDGANYSQTCFDSQSVETQNRFSMLSETELTSTVRDVTMRPVHSSTPSKKNYGTKKFGDTLRILNVNCQSIKKKREKIENMIESTNPDIIFVTETWLDDNINDNEFFPNNFRLWRNDRSSSGGGVLIAVKDTYISTEVPELETECEIKWVKIEIVGRKDLYLCSYYLPKTSDTDGLDKFADSIERARNINNSIILIGGDFNMPGWDWKKKILKQNTNHPNQHYKLLDILDDNGLVQLVEKPTRKQNTLDLIITNSPTMIPRLDVIPGISDHDIVYAELDIKPITKKQIPRKIPLYNRARWDSLKADMRTTFDKLIELKDQTVDNLWKFSRTTWNKV
jgi:exonuclease III